MEVRLGQFLALEEQRQWGTCVCVWVCMCVRVHTCAHIHMNLFSRSLS